MIFSVNVVNMNGLVISSLIGDFKFGFGDFCLLLELCICYYNVCGQIALFLLLLYVAIIYQILVCSCYLYILVNVYL